MKELQWHEILRLRIGYWIIKSVKHPYDFWDGSVHRTQSYNEAQE